MIISETEHKLIGQMIFLGAETKMIHLVCSGLPEGQMKHATATMKDIYQERGEVTEEEMLKTLVVCRHPELWPESMRE